ncbi:MULTISPECIES: PAAR-like protein [Sorangium]|uniref:DUF4280 domain-containing protein n=1 Tax=Sorangium cellulosum (strain So ce56) TaxID=448385 RepID=A9FVA8_SORC5|nr:PAAR-like protein [Sorangium cellulosum]CAN92255.1 hypothetical protein predicted by Glimmer/Critica [Sorangium cellulosum So ce56]
MPGPVLHVGATVLCVHGGQAQATSPNPRVRVGGQPVVTQPGPHAIAGCAFPPPPQATGPCVTAMWVTGATRVRAGGMPLLLQDSQAVCAPTGTGLSVVASQMRVRAQ